jgi:hypothetical protein
MRIAAGNFRNMAGIADLPVGRRFAPVQGLHGIKPERCVICITEAGMGMGCKRTPSILPDERNDRLNPGLRDGSIDAQCNPVFLDRDVPSLDARDHQDAKLPAEALRLALREEAVVIGYRKGIKTLFLCLSHHLPGTVHCIDRPVRMDMEINLHGSITGKGVSDPAPASFSPGHSWLSGFWRVFRNRSGLTRSVVKLPVRIRRRCSGVMERLLLFGGWC